MLEAVHHWLVGGSCQQRGGVAALDGGMCSLMKSGANVRVLLFFRPYRQNDIILLSPLRKKSVGLICMLSFGVFGAFCSDDKVSSTLAICFQDALTCDPFTRVVSHTGETLVRQ